MNILLVDDEKYALSALEEAVSEAVPNSNRASFKTASEAIEYAKNNAVDVAFLDINMRVMNGIEMAKTLMELYPKINIIFCTGYQDYAVEAFQMYCSGYLLKPITEESIEECMEHLRYPVESGNRVRFHCFGNFEAFCDGKPIQFSLSKTKELLAYLVDRDGAECRVNEIIAVIFEDVHNLEYYNKLRRDLIQTFTDLGVEDCLQVSRGCLAVNREKVDCDYFDYLDGDRSNPPAEYMSQFSFAEDTFAGLFL